MKLCMSNIGKVNAACVEINGITVIAGENNTGKSTIGKALFAVFNSFYDSGNKIMLERTTGIVNQLQLLDRNLSALSFREYSPSELAREIIEKTTGIVADESHIRDVIIDTINHYDEQLLKFSTRENIEDSVNRILDILRIPDDVIFQTVLQKCLDSEFNEQLSNMYSDAPGNIRLEIQSNHVDISIHNNQIVNISNRLNLGTEAIYIDDPFVLDDVSSRIFRSSRYADHRTHLKEKLFYNRKSQSVVEEIVANNKFNYIYSKLSAICEGNVVRNKPRMLSYQVTGSDKMLDVKNLSTGLKTFAILKRLLVTGCIEPNGTIILDEPEIHLHPEWQLLFAELVVLLHREFGLHILLNTHSPYFLNAIEVYAAKYNAGKKCKYYLANDHNTMCTIADVTDNIEEIYRRLARPLQVLENERYRND